MGIPSFFSHLVRQHPDCIKEIAPTDIIDNLYMDSNSVVYDCVRKIADEYVDDESFEKKLREAVLQSLIGYIQTLQPSRRCLIAFDGVAPAAKLKQQRNRRYKSMIERGVDETLLGRETKSWNTAAITPGTAFMNDLMPFLREGLGRNGPQTVEIIVSGSDVAGEGEHKIFDFIRKNQCPQFSRETHVIYGLDADLIMLTLNHLHVSRNLYLFRETPHFIAQVDSSLEPDKLYNLDIPALSAAVADEMGKHRDMDKRSRHVINDYILLCFLLGNDFMPHFPSINIRSHGIDILLTTYKKVIGGTRHFLTAGDRINWNQVRKLFEELRGNEVAYLQSEHKERSRLEGRSLPTKTFEDKKYKYLLLPTKNREAEKFIDPWSPGWQSRYYQELFDVRSSDDVIRRICVNYMEALEWTLCYYVKGCKDWRWSYGYCYPPLICDLCKHLPCFETEFVSHKAPEPIDNGVQLAYVLPVSSLALAGNRLRDVLLKRFPEQYRDDYTQKWSYCKYIWESHVDLPEFSLELLGETVTGLK
jgi:5'-3' exonuclease